MKVTKWSTFIGDLTVNEHKADQIGIGGESGSLDAAPAVSNSSIVRNEPVSASEAIKELAGADTPRLVPGQGGSDEATAANAPKADTAKADTAKADTAKADTAKADTPKADISKADTPKADAPKGTAKAEASRAEAPRAPGKIMIMSSGDHAWAGNGAGPEPGMKQGQGIFGKRRIAALAAVVALAALAGALGGALATVGFTHFAGDDAATGSSRALEATVARIDSDVVALKTSVEHTSRIGMSQFNKTSERLDKVEKAQAEPAAKLAKLSEAVDKLRAAPVAAPAPVAAAPAAAKEVTGSIAPVAAAPAPKVEVARLPTVEGWLLRDVGRGGALIEGRRQGLYEVYAGDEIPGLGRIDAVRKQDGRWVVVTSKGLIVAR
jgi:hypothetical protein